MIANRAPSRPVMMDQVRLAPASGSAATSVVTVVLFSTPVMTVDGPPPPEVMTGASLALVTVRLMVWVSVSVPSETWTMTS